MFLLTKRPTYFYDAVAIEEEGEIAAGTRAAKGSVERAEQANGRPPEYAVYTGKRNKRSVWWVATRAFSESHFATMPPDIAETCILAGTSEKGCCSACGAPWIRVVERGEPTKETTRGKQAWAAETGQRDSIGGLPVIPTTTLGWRPSCLCRLPNTIDAVPWTPRACTVLDPFGGAGTTALVADRLGRDAILIELNPAYAEMARNRVVRDAGLFAEVAG